MASIAPMEAPCLDEDVSVFPLRCILCPKKPKFSDMSHLLTHVSSKSHLHHKFNMEFSAKSDPGVKEDLQRYEQWYSENKIESHLSNRLASKGQKKSGRRGRSTAVGPKGRQSMSALDTMNMNIGPQGFQTPEHLPTMGHWNTAPASHSMHLNELRESSYLADTGYQSPLAFRTRQQPYFYPDDLSGNGQDMKGRVFVMDSAQSTAPPSEMGTSISGGVFDDDAQASRLKGIVWPGMDIFDAATPDQKRMRNQRKDVAAIDLLKITSEHVTATETVWGPGGDVRKVRDIYASPSVEGSPPSTPPRKRKTRARNATPMRSAADEGNGNSSKTKRIGRLSLPDTSIVHRTRATAKTAESVGKMFKAPAPNVEITSDDAALAVGSLRQKGPFGVYYDDQAPGPGEASVAANNVSHDNGFDQNQHSRSVLQNLDPNLTISSEPSPYFKHSSSNTRFFEGSTESPHMSFQSQTSSYGNGFHGMSSTSLNPLCSQPRSAPMYTSFDNSMFNGQAGGEASPSFPPGNSRRLGFGGYGMDANSGPFGYSEQRESNIREPGFTDPSYRSAPGLFDM